MPSRSSSSTSMGSSSTASPTTWSCGSPTAAGLMPRRPRRVDKGRRNFVETATQERTSRTFEQAAIANGDAAAAALGVTQRVIGPLTELALATAKENTRLAAELQVAAIEALHDSQVAASRRMAAWPDMVMDPLRLCHRA